MSDDNPIATLKKPQAYPPERFALHSERLGPLPLVNHFLQRMGLPALLEKFVPTADRRRAVTHAQALGVLLRSILVKREPVYRQEATVHGFAPGCFGIDAAQMVRLTDDRIGQRCSPRWWSRQGVGAGGFSTAHLVCCGYRLSIAEGPYAVALLAGQIALLTKHRH